MRHTKTVSCNLSVTPENTLEEVGAETLPVWLYCGKGLLKGYYYY